MPRHVRKGDSVMITSGDHRGKVGEVLRVIPKNDRVVVQGLNLRTKHVKPTQLSPQGGIISPILANMTLDGLQAVLERHFGKSRMGRDRKIYLVRYADDVRHITEALDFPRRGRR